MVEERTSGLTEPEQMLHVPDNQYLYIFDDGRFGVGGPPTNNDRDAELDGNLSILKLNAPFPVDNYPLVEEKDGYHYPCNAKTY